MKSIDNNKLLLVEYKKIKNFNFFLLNQKINIIKFCFVAFKSCEVI